jgi:acyl-coenzyme A synthetase/AMP-(fatty) acid ligase/surfactin synthase thioesterase subunit
MNLIDRLVGGHVAAGHEARVAYVDPDLGEVSYAQLLTATRRYAGMLRDLDVSAGTRAMVVGDDSVATIVAVLGLWARRCVPVPVSPLLADSELTFIAQDCVAGFAHVDGPAARQADLERLFPALPRCSGDAVRELVRAPADPGAEVEPEDWATDREVVVQYTSGSTGVPKGVLHGLAGIEAVLGGFGATLGLTRDDTVLSTAKLSFGYGFGNSLLFPLAAGATAVLLRGPVDAHRLSATVRERRPTVLFSVPRLYHGLASLGESGPAPDLRSLRWAVSAGEHLPADLQARFEEGFGVPLVNGLGATEVLHIVLAARPGDSARGTTGWAVPGVTATLRDERGGTTGGDNHGRLHIAGPTVALGYLDRPEQTARTFADGGAYTGDVMRRGGAGDLWYVCRGDDMLNFGGYKVSPLEIEMVVRRVSGVADCAVVGGTDGAGLQQAVTYVVATAGADRGEVRRAVVRAFRDHLAPFKRPGRVEVLDALPTTSTGKLARFKLRAAAAEPVAEQPVEPSVVRLSVTNPGRPRSAVLIPYAGGSAQAYARLTRQLPRTWTVVTGEASYGPDVSLESAADAWWHAAEPHVRRGTVLFGHSLGAALVAEIARRHADRLAGVHVVISAPPARLSDSVLAAVDKQDEDALLEVLAESGLLPTGPLLEDELRRLVVPRVMADLRVLRDGWPARAPKTTVTVLAGMEDVTCRPADVPAVLGEWPVTRLRLVEGGHYFCVENPTRTAELLREAAGE